MTVQKKTNHFFDYKNTRIQYTKTGSGAKALLCFHGFGLTSDSFDELSSVYGEDYTIYAFDLFFHGKSEWNRKENVLTELFWNELLENFLNENSINRFSLLGYSIGARLVWATLHAFSDRVEAATVIAPDGIHRNVWYTLATRTKLGRTLFKSIVLNHHRIHKVLKFSNRYKLAPTLVIRFAESQLDTAEKRNRVYKTWLLYRPLESDPQATSAILNSSSFELNFVLGKMDKIITQKRIDPLFSLIKNKQLVLLEAGHTHLIKAFVEKLKSENSNFSE